MPRLLSKAEYCKRILHETPSTKIYFIFLTVSDLSSSFLFNIEYCQINTYLKIFLYNYNMPSYNYNFIKKCIKKHFTDQSCFTDYRHFCCRLRIFADFPFSFLSVLRNKIPQKDGDTKVGYFQLKF